MPVEQVIDLGRHNHARGISARQPHPGHRGPGELDRQHCPGADFPAGDYDLAVPRLLAVAGRRLFPDAMDVATACQFTLQLLSDFHPYLR